MSGKRQKAQRRAELVALAQAVEAEARPPHIRPVVDRMLQRQGLNKVLRRGFRHAIRDRLCDV